MAIQRTAETHLTLEWMDLRALQKYACVSERTLREWIHRGVDSLQAVRIGSKILVHRAVFDRWLNSHPVAPADGIDVDRIADEVLTEVSR